MENNPMILALYPNGYGMGYVLAESPDELIYYGMARIRPMTSRAHIKRFKKLLAEYEPSLVILRGYKKGKRHTSPRVERVISALEKHAFKKGLKVFRYTRENIKQVFVEFKANTKHQIAKALVEFLPELKDRLPKDRKYPEAEPWTMGMFDCISLLLTYYYLND
jgi:Holliday junction resolvasome RuvABC endonuclease subunit